MQKKSLIVHQHILHNMLLGNIVHFVLPITRVTFETFLDYVRPYQMYTNIVIRYSNNVNY